MQPDASEVPLPPPRRRAQVADDALFCIHSYAGDAGPACAWRGRLAETLRPTDTSTPRCPRCGRATLLELPPAAQS